MLKKQQLILPFSVLLLGLLNTAQAELPQITDARIIQPPPGAKVAAAYFTVTNTHDQPLVINSVSSDAVPQTSLHLSSVVDDVARMEEQESITVNAGESLAFEHGSYHVMLMGLTEPLTAGSDLSLVLETSEGPLPITIPVITPDDATAMNAKPAMDHSKMKMEHDDAEHDTMKHDKMDRK